MRTLLNLFANAIVLFLASLLFPSVVVICSLRALILAAALIWVISIVVVLSSLLITGLGIIYPDPFWIIIGIIAVFFAEVIALSILSNTLDGFAVIGFWPKVLLAICLTACHNISDPPGNPPMYY